MAFAFIPLSSHAAVYISQQNYTLDADEVAEGNIYAGGTSITINGTINGDFIAAGSTLTLNGILQDDVIVAGGNVTVSGTLNDDFRAAAGTIIVTGTIEGDVNVAGGTVTIAENATINGDVTVASGQLIHEGTINGNLGLSAGEVRITGTVNKNVEGRVETLEVTSTAIIGGLLQYEGPNQATISSDASIGGETVFTQKSSDRFGKYFGTIGLTIAAFFANLVGTLIVALVLVTLFAAFSQKVTATANDNFWKAFLIGLLVLIVMPVLGVLLFVTLLGIPLAVMVLIIYMMLIMIGTIYAGILAGSYLMKLFKKEKAMRANWQAALLGVIVLQAVMLVPFVGWLIALIFLFAGLGAFSTTLFRLLSKV